MQAQTPIIDHNEHTYTHTVTSRFLVQGRKACSVSVYATGRLFYKVWAQKVQQVTNGRVLK